jgi:hypothetical protein
LQDIELAQFDTDDPEAIDALPICKPNLIMSGTPKRTKIPTLSKRQPVLFKKIPKMKEAWNWVTIPCFVSATPSIPNKILLK